MTRRRYGRRVSATNRPTAGRPAGAGQEATIKPILVAASALLASACATAPPAPDPRRFETVFADALFEPPARPVDAADLFAVNDAMRAFADQHVVPLFREHGRFRGLYRAMREQLRLDYDTSITRNAAETFAARSGNCLSLVVLTAALAHAYDIPFQYQNVRAQGAWSRADDLVFYSGHVNLLLGPRAIWLDRNPEPALIVDFLMPRSPAYDASRPIPESTVVAMYLNNRAAETLVAGDVNQAYWWARAAVAADPAYVMAYNTLGVIYRRHGNLAEAERALRIALEREPANVKVLSNLRGVLLRLGRDAEAAAVHAQVVALAPYPPFYFLDQGIAALARGDYDAASRLLKRELARMPYDDEVHFALGLVELQRGKPRDARRYVARALEHSTTRDRREIYAAKLDVLERMR